MDFIDFDKKKPSSEFIQESLRQSLRRKEKSLKSLSKLKNFVLGPSQQPFLEELFI